MNDGGPAFPLGCLPETPSCGGLEEYARVKELNQKMKGMSLRDWFAGMAFQRLAYMTDSPSQDANLCYRYADAMLTERAKHLQP